MDNTPATFNQKQVDNSITRQKVFIASVLFMGLGHMMYLKQYIKGLLYALLEVVFIIFIPTIVAAISDLISLGDPQPGLPVAKRDNSLFMMIDGVVIIAIVIMFFAVYVISVRNALEEYNIYHVSGRFKNNKTVFGDLLGKSFHIVGLIPGVLLVVFFVVIPLIFSACVAFTNYSAPEHLAPSNTIDWVGFENFTIMFGGNAKWTGAFTRVAIWTLVWAVLATVTCYFGGIILAYIMKENNISFPKVFRTIFILPYAIPAVISMLVWRNLLNGSFGIVNRTLIAIGITDSPIPWLSDPSLAKFVCIAVNLWAGFSYFMLLGTGTMTAVSEDIFEAARIDGASKTQIFKYITLPLVLYQTMPLIIMSLAHNINNFGAIFFLTDGAPTVADTTTTLAGGTDLLITWIYDLTVESLKYNYASVLAVVIFVVIAPFAVFNFRRTKSYREGEL